MDPTRWPLALFLTAPMYKVTFLDPDRASGACGEITPQLLIGRPRSISRFGCCQNGTGSAGTAGDGGRDGTWSWKAGPLGTSGAQPEFVGGGATGITRQGVLCDLPAEDLFVCSHAIKDQPRPYRRHGGRGCVRFRRPIAVGWRADVSGTR